VIDQAAVGNTPLTLEAWRDTPFLFYFFSRNQDDAVHLKFQMPHKRDPTTSVKPHLHVAPMANASGNVRLAGRYAWWGVNAGALPAWAGWTSFSVTAPFAAADQYKQIPVPLFTAEPRVGAHASDFLLIHLARGGSSDVLDTYEGSKDHGSAAANLCLVGLDTHYQIGRLGTDDEF
jgi:hypothetical protein